MFILLLAYVDGGCSWNDLYKEDTLKPIGVYIADTKVSLFLKDMENYFWNSQSCMLISKESINHKERKEYLKTGYKHMYFEDFYTSGDGIEILLEEKNQDLINFIQENY